MKLVKIIIRCWSWSMFYDCN